MMGRRRLSEVLYHVLFLYRHVWLLIHFLLKINSPVVYRSRIQAIINEGILQLAQGPYSSEYWNTCVVSSFEGITSWGPEVAKRLQFPSIENKYDFSRPNDLKFHAPGDAGSVLLVDCKLGEWLLWIIATDPYNTFVFSWVTNVTNS